MKTAIKNAKTNTISEYGFICGYIQQEETENSRIELYREHNIYHVKSINKNRWPMLQLWESFEKLTEARKHYKSECKKYKNL
jgi:hypothetical protein